MQNSNYLTQFDNSQHLIKIHLDSVKDFELLISISTEKIKPKCLALKLKSISDSSFTFDKQLNKFYKNQCN